MTDAPTPNRDVIRRWVAALRSGDYVQGTGYLHEVVDGRSFYCCLGVLCDLALREGVVERRKLSLDVCDAQHVCYSYGIDDDDRTESVLPPSVVRWAGLGDDGVHGSGDPVIGDLPLTTWNDGDASDGYPSRSFVEIADALERTYLPLSSPPPPPGGTS